MKTVKKMTDNKGGVTAETPSATTDKIFLLSSTEVWGDLDSDGTQYEYYKSKGVTTSNYSGASSSYYHWARSVYPNNSASLRSVYSDGDCNSSSATSVRYVCPAFCLLTFCPISRHMDKGPHNPARAFLLVSVRTF